MGMENRYARLRWGWSCLALKYRWSWKAESPGQEAGTPVMERPCRMNEDCVDCYFRIFADHGICVLIGFIFCVGSRP
jgi:hypothetical protein